MARKRTPTTEELDTIESFFTHNWDNEHFGAYSAKALWDDLNEYFGDSWASPKLKYFVFSRICAARDADRIIF